MSNIITKEVDFNGATLMAVQTKDDGKIYGGVKWFCDGLGMSENQRIHQTSKIQDDAVLAKGVRKILLPTKGGKQEVLCIELHFLPLWLAKINANIIDNPEIQEKLIDYQLHAADVLAAAFLGQSQQAQPRSTSRIKPAVKDAFDAAEYLQTKLGVKPGIAQAACLRSVEKNCGLDLTEIAKLLPAADHDTGFLNATEIGKRIGLSAAKTNLLLVDKGLQVKKEDKWRLTDAGKLHAEEMPFVKNGHSDYQIRWNESVVDALREQPTETAAND